jgi:tellurite resistance protein
MVDKSEIFRAFLLLIGRSGKIAPEERETLLSFARILDLDREFAESFLKDAIAIAFADDEFHHKESEWLMSIARANAIANEWLENAVEEYKQHFSGLLDLNLRKYL